MTELTVNPTQMTQLINTHTEVRLVTISPSLIVDDDIKYLNVEWKLHRGKLTIEWQSKEIDKATTSFHFFF